MIGWLRKVQERLGNINVNIMASHIFKGEQGGTGWLRWGLAENPAGACEQSAEPPHFLNRVEHTVLIMCFSLVWKLLWHFIMGSILHETHVFNSHFAYEWHLSSLSAVLTISFRAAVTDNAQLPYALIAWYLWTFVWYYASLPWNNI